MKHLFIMNPISGEKKERDRIRANIHKFAKEAGADYELYETKYKGDAAQFMRDRVMDCLSTGANSTDGNKPALRFYFCGGDGSAYEAVDTFMRLPNEARNGMVEIGIIPVGTGNDFIRNFGTAKDFLDISKQLSGSPVMVDAMRFEGTSLDGETCVKHSANMFNIGFDCQVVKKVNELRDKIIMRKRLAYPTGVAIELIKIPHTRLNVSFPDGIKKNGKFLLTFVANGKFCGGGFRSASDALVDDGELDCMLVNPVGRLKFISFVGKYKKGQILGSNFAKNNIFFKRTPSITLENSEGVDVCIDGEVESFTKIVISAVNKVLPFVVPKGAHTISLNGEV